MSPESRMMNPGNARPFLVIHSSLSIANSSLFTLHSSLFDCSSLFTLHCYKGKVSTPVSAHVDI